jgi:hypothetical protein
MDAIMDIARRHRLLVIEDAAQGLMARYNGRALGSFAPLSALSFHETKNIISGEGGALLINDLEYSERAEIIREKGTNRSQFFRGQVDKYTGSMWDRRSFLASSLRRFSGLSSRTRRRSPRNGFCCGSAITKPLRSSSARIRCAAHHSVRLRAQRAHVLPDAAEPRRAYQVHRSALVEGCTDGLSLRAASQLARRAEVRSHPSAR